MIGRGTRVRTGLFAMAFLFILQTAGFAEERYTVKWGDSLSKISKAFGVSIEAIRSSNHLEKDHLKANQILLIPVQKEKQAGSTITRPAAQKVESPAAETARRAPSETVMYIVKKGDSLYTIAKQLEVSIEEVRRLNHLQSTAIRADQILLIPKSAGATEEEEGEAGDTLDVAKVQPVEEEEDFGTSEPNGKWKSSEERNLFVRIVKTFLGVPYRLGGSTLKGIDCSAFVKKIYEIFNIQLPRTSREQLQAGKGVGKGELVEGDLVFFKTQTRRASSAHVGIYIGNNEFVHASSRNREVKVDSLDMPYFSKRFLKGVRVKELDKELSL